MGGNCLCSTLHLFTFCLKFLIYTIFISFVIQLNDRQSEKTLLHKSSSARYFKTFVYSLDIYSF